MDILSQYYRQTCGSEGVPLDTSVDSTVPRFLFHQRRRQHALYAWVARIE